MCGKFRILMTLLAFSPLAVLAQASDVDCNGCVDNEDLSAGAVTWWTMNPSLRSGLTRQRNEIDSLLAGSGLRVTANGQDVGAFYRVMENDENGEIFGLLAISSTGYSFTVITDPEYLPDAGIGVPQVRR